MAFTVDLSTDIGKTRLLLSDTDSTKPVFPDDAQIQVLLDMEDSVPRLAAAAGLELIASNRVMVMQVVKLLDLQLDGRATSEALLKAAQAFRDAEEQAWTGFDIAQQVDNSSFAWRELMLKDFLRRVV